jgi:hypothetical protein
MTTDQPQFQGFYEAYTGATTKLTPDYLTFLAEKRIVSHSSGFDVSPAALNPALFDWQRDIVRWALKRGKAAVWADCGLGKSLQQLVWAEQVSILTDGPVLILAPAAVSRQTVEEARKFGINATLAASQQDIAPGSGVWITNYEKLHKFNPGVFSGVVLDESSILKAYDGKTRTAIIDAFAQTPYKLACTATPSPNDFMEIGNHAQFLGVMSHTEMLATFFTHDGGDTSKWRLKGHAQDEFWKWVCSWAVLLRRPSDLGYDDNGFNLPPIHRHQHEVAVEHQEETPADGAQLMLFAMEAQTLIERRNARKVSIPDRVRYAADVVAQEPHEQWLIWCNLNDESRSLTKAIPGAVEVTGSDSEQHKEQAAMNFVRGNIRVLVTKPSIFGFGLNFQNCARSAVVGLSDSFEELYQLERRIWRYGQTRAVHMHYIVSELEGAVVRNIERKQQQYEAMVNGMLAHMRHINQENVRGLQRETTDYQPAVEMRLPDWVRSEVYV